MIIVQVLSGLLFIYLFVTIGYMAFMAVAGRWGRIPHYTSTLPKNKIAVVIPSFREDHIIVETVQQAVSHNYPDGLFRVVVVADQLRQETVVTLRRLPVDVLEVTVSMKSRSILAALTFLDGKGFNIAVILDADNVMGNNCLELINAAFVSGCQALQCHRTAKNQDTPVALLDAISEEINVNLFRRGPVAAGLPASPAGSGMAFSFPLLKAIFSLPSILDNPGEDREIDMQLMKRGIFMHFLDDAYVYDEKVASKQVFEKQRVRWLEAQWNHLHRFWDEDMQELPKNLVYCIKYFQNLLLPRVLLIMLLGIIFIIACLALVWPLPGFFPGPAWWFVLVGLYAGVLVVSVPKRFYSLATLKAASRVPGLMLSMVRALFKMKKGRKEFLHTPKAFRN
jgi:cellulose synthase/poly-beta-1,6-N-acetylglucosamine synthase-like glycosyltransferase